MFTKKWEIDHDFTCVSKYLIHNFQCFQSIDFNTASQLYKKYEKQPDSEIFNQVMNIYEYV